MQRPYHPDAMTIAVAQVRLLDLRLFANGAEVAPKKLDPHASFPPPRRWPQKLVRISRQIHDVWNNQGCTGLRIECGAGPTPLVCFAHKSRHYRILVNVIELIRNVTPAATNEIEIARLPKRPLIATSLLD